MNKILIAAISSGSLLLTVQNQAHAHIEYIDMGALPPVVNGDAIKYSNSGVVSSNFGWADATDVDWGDSHNGAFARFQLTDLYHVEVKVESDYQNTFITIGSQQYQIKVGDLTPAFTVYSGVLPDEAHDTAVPLLPGKEGAWSALSDTTMTNDYNQTGTVSYLGHAGVVDGLATSVTWTNVLGPGLYSIAIGGTCYFREECGALGNESTNQDERIRGFNIDLNLRPVPLPSSIWFMGTALFGLARFRRKNCFEIS